MLARLFFLVACLLAGCEKQQENSACDDMCTEMVAMCGMEAYPSMDSCLQGCEYSADQGADVGAQLLCVQQASCDPFALVECEHAYGLD